MSQKYDGTRVIHGECRLEATSPWGDDVVLDGLRLHLDLHIVPRRTKTTSSRGAADAWRRASAGVRALCFGSWMRRARALVLGMGAVVLALAVWSVRAPSGSHEPSTAPSAAPGVAVAPEASPVTPRAARNPAASPTGVTPIPPQLVVPPHASPPSPVSPSSPAPKENTPTRRKAPSSRSAPPAPAEPRLRAVQSFAAPPAGVRAAADDTARPSRGRATSDGVISVATPPRPLPRSTTDLLDLFGDTK